MTRVPLRPRGFAAPVTRRGARCPYEYFFIPMSIFISLCLQFDRGVLLRERVPDFRSTRYSTMVLWIPGTRVLASTGVQVPEKLTMITVLEFCILLQGPGICHLFIICTVALGSRALSHHMHTARRVTR